MARAADQGSGGGGLPFVKFAKIGDRFVGAFASDVAESRRQQRKFKTGELLWKDAPGPDGKPVPLMEEVMYFVAMPGTVAYTGNKEEENLVLIEPSAHVRFAISGFKWGQVIDARKQLEPYAGFPAGKPCSGDIYEIELVARSKATDNPAAAIKAGFEVLDGKRIVMRSDEKFEEWAMMRVRAGQDTNAANDYRITIRRPRPDEKRWEQEADALFDSKPWKAQAMATAGGGSEPTAEDLEPF